MRGSALAHSRRVLWWFGWSLVLLVGVSLLIHVGYVEVVFAVCNPHARFPPRFSLDGVDDVVEVGAEPVEVVGGYGSSGGSFVFPAFMRGICFPQLLQT